MTSLLSEADMKTLIPTLVLALISFLSSAFVILCVLAPLVPDSRTHPLTRRNPQNPTLSQPEQAYIWLAVTTILSAATLSWEALHKNSDVVGQPMPSIRLHLALTVTPTCLCIITLITLLQVRKAKASSFGPLQLLIWLPVLILTVISSIASGLVANVTTRSIQIVTGSYMYGITIMSTIAMVCLIATLSAIRRNLSTFNEFNGSLEDLTGNAKPFPPGDVEALKDGSSWITSDSGVNHVSISSFSFGSQDEERNSLTPANALRRSDEGSQRENSWLAEPSTAPPTMPDWSFPTSKGKRAPGSAFQDFRAVVHDGILYPCTRLTPTTSPSHAHFATPARRTQPDLDGCQGEKGLVLPTSALPKSVNVSWSHISAWLAFIWLPPILALPFIVLGPSQTPISVLLIVAVTIPAPMLAFNVVFCPLPIPTDLFGEVSNLPKSSKTRSRHKISGSMTVVEGCRSGDVWLSKGDAIDGKGKLSRATSLLTPVPKLSVLPVKSEAQEENSRRDETQHAPQYDSAATSAFVAINAYCDNELGWLPGSEGRQQHEGSLDQQNFLMRSRSSASSQALDFPTSVSVSRRSSTSSMSSRTSRSNRGAFTTNLETILDVSMESPPRPSHPKDPDGGDYCSPGDPCLNSDGTNHTFQGLVTSPPPVGTTSRMMEVDGISLLSQLVPALLAAERLPVNNGHNARTPRGAQIPVHHESCIDFPKVRRSASLASQAYQEQSGSLDRR